MNRVHRVLQILIIILSCLHAGHIMAGDTVKVLMFEHTKVPGPSPEPDSVDMVSGKVFFKGQIISGDVEIVRDKNGLHVVNNIPFEQYIETAVAAEAGEDWDAEALKAQAVITRTRAIYERIVSPNGYLEFTPQTRDISASDNEIPPVVMYSVNTTRNEILMFRDFPVKAFYHTSCEGKTELPEELWGEHYSYLKSVDCNIKNSHYGTWRRTFRLSKLEKALGIKDIQDIKIDAYTSTGRVKTLIVSTADGLTVSVHVMDFRESIGHSRLPGNQFRVETSGENITFKGRERGHGVGFSQMGALEMARQGKNYREILSHYFPGTEIQHSDEETLQALISAKDNILQQAHP